MISKYLGTTALDEDVWCGMADDLRTSTLEVRSSTNDQKHSSIVARFHQTNINIFTFDQGSTNRTSLGIIKRWFKSNDKQQEFQCYI